MRGLHALLFSALLGGAAGAAAAGADAAALAVDRDTVLLVIAPHPDDETLCCAGVMQRVLSAGGRVSVLWLTSGDGSELGSLLIEKSLFANPEKMRSYGTQRMQEARTATAILGVPAAGQLFLGYPDGGMLRLLTQNQAAAYTSRFTGAAAVPYADAVFPGHPYTGARLREDFAAVLAQVKPTLILAPSPLDSHPDHRAAGLLTIAATAGAAPLVRYWIVHGGEGWPSPRALLEGVPLTPAPCGARLEPRPFALTPTEEDEKLAALKAYHTQMRFMDTFLLSFVRTTELFSRHGTPEDAGR